MPDPDCCPPAIRFARSGRPRRQTSWRVSVGIFVNSDEFSRRQLFTRPQRAVELVQWSDFRIHVSPDDADVGRPVTRGSYESHVEAAVRKHLKPGMVMIDIGANIGFFAMMGAAIVGPTGHVHAVEPNPDNVRMIEASRRVNAFDHLSVWQTAAARDFGVLMLNASHSNGTTAAISPEIASVLNAHTVMASPLGRLLPGQRKIDFIKIDVEGAEAAALEGLQDLLARDHPVIVTEFCPPMLQGISGRSGQQYLEFLLGHGYELAVLKNDLSLLACGREAGHVLQAYAAAGVDHIDVLATPS